MSCIPYKQICSNKALNAAAIPLELKGKIDPNKSHKVKFLFNGLEKEMEVPETTSLLDAAGNMTPSVSPSQFFYFPSPFLRVKFDNKIRTSKQLSPIKK